MGVDAAGGEGPPIVIRGKTTVSTRSRGVRAQTRRPSDRAYVYVDETALDLPSGRLFGAGALFVREPVEGDLIDRAMSALRDDPDRRPSSARFDPKLESLDAQTFERGFFHASEDTKNAHSHFAKEIRAGVQGEFHAAFGPSKGGSTRTFRDRTLDALLPFLRQGVRLDVTFEQRSGFDNGGDAQRLVDHLFRGLDVTAFELLSFRNLYPRIDVRIESKHEPGLQVTDMLLWSLGKEKYGTGPAAKIAKEWCGLDCWADAKDQGSGLTWLKAVLGDGRQREDVEDSGDLFPYPDGLWDEVNRPASWEELLVSYAFAERWVRHAAGGLPPHATHFMPAVADCLQVLGRPGHASVEKVAHLFVRLFDTFPIYRQVDKADRATWARLLRAKRCMAVLVHRHDPMAIEATRAIVDGRAAEVAVNAQIFGL